MENQTFNHLAESIRNGALLLDVRTPEEFNSGSVEGAINIPLNMIPQQIAKLINKGKIIVFCASGTRSEQAKMYLEQQGFECEDGGCWFEVEEICQQLHEH